MVWNLAADVVCIVVAVVGGRVLMAGDANVRGGGNRLRGQAVVKEGVAVVDAIAVETAVVVAGVKGRIASWRRRCFRWFLHVGRRVRICGGDGGARRVPILGEGTR